MTARENINDDQRAAPVYLSALGLLCNLGDEPGLIAQRLVAGWQEGLQPDDKLLPARPVYVGKVADVPAMPMQRADGSALPLCFHSRNNALLLAAYRRIAAPVAQAIARFGVGRVAVVIGTSTSGISEGEAALLYRREHGEFPAGFDYAQQEMGNAAHCLADYLGIDGIAYCISTACSSGAKALAAGQRLLRAGVCDAVLAGGVDTLCRMTVQGFAALDSVAGGRCKPFDVARDGINIGEGAALFLLTRERGFAGDAEHILLAGCGEASDAHHISAPDPAGAGGELAIRAALQAAELPPQAIAYINLHGTATRKNDEMEAALVNRIFGAETPCSSTKSLTGHTLGAAGAIEAGLCWLLLSSHSPQRRLPPQTGCFASGRPAGISSTVDPALPPLRLVTDESLPAGDVALLSTSFAFGGSNAAVILRRLSSP